MYRIRLLKSTFHLYRHATEHADIRMPKTYSGVKDLPLFLDRLIINQLKHTILQGYLGYNVYANPEFAIKNAHLFGKSYDKALSCIHGKKYSSRFHEYSGKGDRHGCQEIVDILKSDVCRFIRKHYRILNRIFKIEKDI